MSGYLLTGSQSDYKVEIETESMLGHCLKVIYNCNYILFPLRHYTITVPMSVIAVAVVTN